MLALSVAAPGEATATRLDGTTVAGRVERWKDGRITLQSADGPVDLAESDLLSLRLAPATSAASGLPVVEWVDGTVLPLAEFHVADSHAALTLAASSAGKPQSVRLPVQEVRAVRLQSLSDSALAQWREIRDLDPAGDLLVVLQRGGESLDYLEGVLREVTPSEIGFELDGETLRVPRRKVAGLVYYRADPTDPATPRCVLLGRDGLHVPARSVELDGESLRLVALNGTQLAWPLADVHTADFSAGKLVMLSDLEPVATRWQPLVALPAAAEHLNRFGQPRFDRSATGGPLSLAFPNERQPDGSGRIESFAKGLAIRSRTELVFRLPRGYRRFLAIAGIEPAMRATGGVQLTIAGDDRVLLETPLTGQDAPLEIDLDVQDVRRLRILVDYGPNLDTGDWLNLCNARIVK